MATVYMFTIRTNSNRTYLNTMDVWLQKNRAGLIAILKEPEFALDKYEDLRLDASDSFDEETMSKSGLRYRWICPT